MVNPVMPARGHSTAPKFDPTKPRELRRFFDELELLFTACAVTDSDLMKKHACIYVDIDSAELWESLAQYATGVSFGEFRKAIHKLYPGSEDDRKWAISDMDKVVGEQLRIGIFDANDLGMYYRSFYNITQFLRTKNRISDAEQSRAFVRGFQPGLWTRIARRLELKFPDHYPDDAYTLQDIHDAALFVLAGTATSNQHTGPTQNTTAPASTSRTAPSTHVKSEDLALILDRFAATIATAIASSKASGAPRTGTGLRQEQTEALICIFCGLTGHFISDCLTCQAYINDGKCKRNAEGKVVLPNGSFVPRSIPGRFIKERVDEWIRRNPDVAIVPALMYGIASSPVSTPGIYQITDISKNTDERISALEKELFALRSGKPFNRTDNRHVASSPQPHISRPLTSNVPAPAPTVPVRTTAPLAPTTTNPSASTSQPPIHPYAGAKENSYLPPHERNFASGSKGKEREGPSHHTRAPIQNETIAQDIFARSMKTPIVTLTSEELLSLSPEVRTKWREQITSKRVQHESNDATHMLDEDAIIVADPYETYINSLQPGQIPEPFVVAKDSHSIRAVQMDVDGDNTVESVVDPGSSIIAMAEDICHELGLAYDPKIRLPMQSANGGIDETLGLARNVPCKLGSITLYLQIHIIRDPAYDILLGRPFDVLTESVVRNYRNEAQTITISDPNSTRSATIPSIPRSHRRRKIVREDFRI